MAAQDVTILHITSKIVITVFYTVRIPKICRTILQMEFAET